MLEVSAVEHPSDPDVAARIRDLEHRLDTMIVERVRERESQQSLEADLPVRRRSTIPPRPSSPPPPEDVLDSPRELFSTDFYLRKWGRLGLRNRSEEVDEFGYDPVYERKVLPFFDLLYDKYFRVEAHGVERVPAEGRCLLVANHSGTLPFDGIMLRLAVRREHPSHRDVRWLAEDLIFHLPFLGSFTNRVGAVRACQENAERLLDHKALVAVFPEGMKGIGKLFRERYKLQLGFEATNVFNHLIVQGASPLQEQEYTLTKAGSQSVLVPYPLYKQILQTQAPPDGTTARRAQASLRITF